MKKALLIIIALGLSVLVLSCGTSEPKPTPARSWAEILGIEPTQEPAETPEVSAAPTTDEESNGGGTSDGPKDLHVAVHLSDPADPDGIGQHAFSPNVFTFNVGDKVTFELRGRTELHTFNVDDLSIYEVVSAGQTKSFAFTFDKPGTFKLICVPHESLGMTGTIIVK